MPALLDQVQAGRRRPGSGRSAGEGARLRHSYFLAQTPQDMADAKRMGEDGIANAIFSGMARRNPMPTHPDSVEGYQRRQNPDVRALIETLRRMSRGRASNEEYTGSIRDRRIIPPDRIPVPADDPTLIHHYNVLHPRAGKPLKLHKPYRREKVPSHGVVG